MFKEQIFMAEFVNIVRRRGKNVIKQEYCEILK